jgi:hypothetical protein
MLGRCAKRKSYNNAKKKHPLELILWGDYFNCVASRVISCILEHLRNSPPPRQNLMGLSVCLGLFCLFLFVFALVC